jgi:hypothetical protein
MLFRRTYLAPFLLVALLSACGDDEPTATLILAPSEPTAVVATIGDGSVSLAFSPPASDGGAPITTYVATCAGGGASVTGNGAASPVTVSGLTNGTEYSCTVAAGNSAGTGVASASVAVTPAAAQ